ncbi:MAG: acyl-CoA dehydrogenase family protein [Candidatus Krumholzibacteria bacterium]|jgi:alkylation response protein AidB-like acyl-CoA dehydrogenase|nr:acyl-CoA dehydrogenase family protein [Candidatus Krumholzibacteria bacterium]
MDLDLNDQQRMLRDATRQFAEQRLLPQAKAAEEAGTMAPELRRELAAMGYCGIGTPERYGGSGLDAVSYALMVSELSYGDASVGVTVSVTNSLVQDPILMFGTEEQKQRYIPPLARGDVWGGFALTEPAAGTDAGGTRTTAVADGDHYVVNGAKSFVTNGGFADTFVVFVRGDREVKHGGISAFIVERNTPGFAIGKHEDKLGIRASSTTELVFEDCRLPRANLLGEWGQGFKVAMKTLDSGRIGIAAQAHGIAQRALDLAIKYAKERQQFERPLSTFQHIQFRLADMATDIEATRLLLLQAAFAKDAVARNPGARYSQAAAMAKLFASEAAHRVVHQALQIHGGYGYIKEFEIERLYRDQRITEIYEGTSEAMRMVIAASLLK